MKNKNLLLIDDELTKHYYSISEVSELIGEPKSVLRYWEGEFKQLKPRKDGSGNRLFTKKDIAILKRIRYLLRTCSYTIDGANKRLTAHKDEVDVHLNVIERLQKIKLFLTELRSTLEPEEPKDTE